MYNYTFFYYYYKFIKYYKLLIICTFRDIILLLIFRFRNMSKKLSKTGTIINI